MYVTNTESSHGNSFSVVGDIICKLLIFYCQVFIFDIIIKSTVLRKYMDVCIMLLVAEDYNLYRMT